MKQLLRTLTETSGPSGYEAAVREVIRAEIEALADELRVDALGNLIARKGTLGKDGRRVMVTAHMDEIGLVATHVDGSGYVRFSLVGAVANRYLPGARVRFANGALGVIGTWPPGKASQVVPTDRMYIDVGASGSADCPVQIGDPAVFERPFAEIGVRFVAKSMDDRAGVLVLIETLRRLARRPARGPGLAPNEVFFVFTAQEQVGQRGAAVSAYGVDPEIGLSVDVTRAGDTPNGAGSELALGSGPAIKIKEASMLADPRVVAWMDRVAGESNIPVQHEVNSDARTEAAALKRTRNGVLAGGLAIACRYMHSPSEVLDGRDLEHAVALLEAMLSRPAGI